MATDSDRKRVHFLSPAELVERADALADVMGTDRTDLINEALQEFIEDAVEDEQFRQAVAEDYYAGRLDFDTVEALVGAERARTFQLLKQDLASEALDVGEPDDSVDIYDGDATSVEPAE
jgi:predicted transcriptional regulator